MTEPTQSPQTDEQVTLAMQLESATDINACFCIRCGQPDEEELHDMARCAGTIDPFTVADALAVFDQSCEEEPDLDGEARALHCAIVAARLTTAARQPEAPNWCRCYRDDADGLDYICDGHLERGVTSLRQPKAVQWTATPEKCPWCSSRDVRAQPETFGRAPFYCAECRASLRPLDRNAPVPPFERQPEAMADRSARLRELVKCPKVNMPHPALNGERVLGWRVPEDLAGLSDGLFLLDELTRLRAEVGAMRGAAQALCNNYDRLTGETMNAAVNRLRTTLNGEQANG